jgi:hypothetical protein
MLLVLRAGGLQALLALVHMLLHDDSYATKHVFIVGLVHAAMLRNQGRGAV